MFRIAALVPLAMSIAASGPALAQDASAWAGAYGGVQLSYGDGFQDYGGGTNYDIYGDSYGLFAGYMWSTGAWAYGAELGYAKADFHEYDSGLEFPEYKFNHTLDLKARAGYAMGPALIYGVLGYGFSEWEEGGPSDTYDVEGALFGAGVDYLVTDRVFLGGEVLRRGMDGDYPFDADVTTFTLRAGMTF
ncbi:MAG: hypothetical protein ACK4P8_06910 [Tabrizicola sp.]